MTSRSRENRAIRHVGVQSLKMVLCVVIGCSKRSGRDKDVSFYRIPKIITHRGQRDYELTKKRRDGFLAAISRDDLTEKVLENDRVCSRHFISGKPAALYDDTNPDWLPTLHLGHSKKPEPSKKAAERWERRRARMASDTSRFEAAETLLTLRATSTSECKQDVEEPMAEQDGVATQTDITSVCMDGTREELACCRQVIRYLTARLTQRVTFSEASFENDETVKFYTGLPNLMVLKAVFAFVQTSVPSSELSTNKLSSFQEFVATLVKLRLNSQVQDLAYRLDVSSATISRILLKWLTAMDSTLRRLIVWPDRETLRKTMPECFRASFGTKVAVIIDCFEVFIERPSNLQARASTWSSYKHHNTIKVLLGIAPQGVVTFVSEPWGGRVSDKYLTERCGILDNLLPGDVVLADRGFDITESVGMMQAKLHIPAFTKGKDQLSAMEIDETRTIANVRIHVERVIGNVRQKYSILQSTLPVDFLTKRVGEDYPLINRIIRICCALCNICDSVVPFE